MWLNTLVLCTLLASLKANSLSSETFEDREDSIQEIDFQTLPSTEDNAIDDDSKTSDKPINIDSDTMSPELKGRELKTTEDDVSQKRKEPRRNDIHKCSLPLGMEDGRIPDTSITASTTHSAALRPARSRLNTVPGKAGGGAWAAKVLNNKQWLKVDLGTVTRVSRVVTQGRQESDQWIKTYTLSYSVDGVHWADYKDRSATLVFTGNNDRNTPQGHDLVPPIDARYVRFNVKTWHNHICMRFELYGCRRIHNCAVPVGVEDGRIANSFMSASSSLSAAFLPSRARLNGIIAWIPKVRNNKQWLRIDLSEERSITRVATQGRYNVLQYVKTFYLSHSMDGSHWVVYKKNSHAKLFAGNVDANTVVSHVLKPRIHARFIRFQPHSWHSYIAMRVEVYGCKAAANCKQPLGVEDGRVANAAMTSTTAYNGNYVAWKGRLNNKGTWIAKVANTKQFIQVDFGSDHKITSVGIQGRYDANQWIRTFTISHSIDGVHWVYIKENSLTKIFPGSNDRHTIIKINFFPAVFARLIRLHPRTWNGHISMRLEYYGCPAGGQKCWSPLGLEDGRLPDPSFSASTIHNGNFVAHRARLNNVGNSWAPRVSNIHQWLQVDLGRATTITKIVTQGRQNANQWVESYYISHSMDLTHWTKYHLSDGKIRVFGGNADRNSLVFNRFSPVIHARGLRVHPKTWTKFIAMRFELYGCHIVSNCLTALGVEDGRVPNGNMRASSIANGNFRPYRARLNLPKQGAQEGGWCAGANNVHQWLQVQFDGPMAITKVETQGRAGAVSYIKSYKLQYSYDSVNWATYKHDSADVVFPGNFDQNTIVGHFIFPVIYAKYIRFRPLTFHGHMCMRVELYGCSAQGIGAMAVTAK